MERIHEACVLLETVTCVQVALHVIALPKGSQIVIIDGIFEVLLAVDVSGKLFHSR